MKINKLIVASHNQGKINEIKTLLAPLKIEVQSSEELLLADVEETGKTFEENAKLKANTISLKCGLPCLADDSGLCVDALGGRPGVMSARYAPNRDFNKGMDMLLKEISASGSKNRKAHFSCCLALACPNKKTKVFEGRVNGTIAEKPQGKTVSAMTRFLFLKDINKLSPSSVMTLKTKFHTAAARLRN